MRILGITGVIGSGKSTSVTFLKRMGFSVHDADEAVHGFLKNPLIKEKLKQRWPFLKIDPEVDRRELAEYVFEHPQELRWLERILHPLVGFSQKAFLNKEARLMRKWVVLDVPLLFETHQQKACDHVLVIRTSSFLQKQRVLNRKGMSPRLMKRIQRCQWSIAEKVKKADTTLVSGLHKGHLFRKLKRLVHMLHESPLKKTQWKPGWKVGSRKKDEARNCFRHRNNGA